MWWCDDHSERIFCNLFFWKGHLGWIFTFNMSLPRMVVKELFFVFLHFVQKSCWSLCVVMFFTMICAPNPLQPPRMPMATGWTVGVKFLAHDSAAQMLAFKSRGQSKFFNRNVNINKKSSVYVGKRPGCKWAFDISYKCFSSNFGGWLCIILYLQGSLISSEKILHTKKKAARPSWPSGISFVLGGFLTVRTHETHTDGFEHLFILVLRWCCTTHVHLHGDRKTS